MVLSFCEFRYCFLNFFLWVIYFLYVICCFFPTHKLFCYWRRNLIGLPDSAHDETILAGIYFLAAKKKRKSSCFVKNIAGTETNWTSLAFLTFSFLTVLRQAPDFSLLIVLELHCFSKGSEKLLMAVRVSVNSFKSPLQCSSLSYLLRQCSC